MDIRGEGQPGKRLPPPSFRIPGAVSSAIIPKSVGMVVVHKNRQEHSAPKAAPPEVVSEPVTQEWRVERTDVAFDDRRQTMDGRYLDEIIPQKPSLKFPAVFQHPVNGYTEQVGTKFIIMGFLFGPIYYLWAGYTKSFVYTLFIFTPLISIFLYQMIQEAVADGGFGLLPVFGITYGIVMVWTLFMSLPVQENYLKTGWYKVR